MPSKAKAVRDLLGETVSDWRRHKAPRLAAALAYYMAFSLAPLLILVILIASLVMGDSRQVREELLGLYLGRSSTSSVYGAAGSLIVILAWVYYSAQILLLGAEFTQVYARRRGSLTAR